MGIDLLGAESLNSQPRCVRVWCVCVCVCVCVFKR